MYTLKLIESNNELKKLYKFFGSLDNTDMPTFKKYKAYNGLGESWGIYDKDSIVGGLVQYRMPKYNAILNYYVPEDTRAKGISWKVFNKCTEFQKKRPTVKTYATSTDISQWRRFAKHIAGNLYEVMIPKV